MGSKALREVACIAKPDTILAWYRRLVAKKFDGSKHRPYPGRPTVEPDVEALVVRMARENTGWGYDRIVGALANLGHRLSDQTVGNILRRHGIAPVPKRSQTTSWKDFIAAHMNVLADADFFTVEVLSWRGLVTYYVVFHSSGEPPCQRRGYHQTCRSRVDGADRPQRRPGDLGLSSSCRYVLHDRDTKFCASFRSVLAAGGVKAIPLPARSPNLNAFAERCVRSAKQDCLSTLILFGERPFVAGLGGIQRSLPRRKKPSRKRHPIAFP